MADLLQKLSALRNFYTGGSTRSYKFRRSQLLLLKKCILQYDSEIEQALYDDLKKSKEESYATETGLVLAEINLALKYLKEWMEPKHATTNLLNFPSSSKIYRDPLGVVLIIAPWNYPLQLMLIPLVSAISGGNCIVLKPSEFAPATEAVIKKMTGETFSPDYILFMPGDGAEIVPAMMKDFRFDHVFYTGSIPVGKIIYGMAAEKLTPVTLELGGKSPAIVHDDADIAVAAKRIVFGKFLNAGQTCIAPDYVLLQNGIKEKFLQKAREAIQKFYGDDPSSSYDYGKIINEKRFDKLVSYLTEGEIFSGGKYDRSQLFIEPTIIMVMGTENTLMKEEIFGPILPVLTFSTTEEAMGLINRNPGPLAFYLFTNNKSLQEQWIQKIPFGGGCINNADWQFTNYNLPFGGVGSSGTGMYHGKYGFETFTRAKPLMKTPTWFDPSLKYPPLKGKLKIFKWFIK